MFLRQLEYLTALAREQHFGRAAAACNVSQPALSTAIRKLEGELGVELVQRSGGRAELTPEGADLLRWADLTLVGVEGLRSEAARLKTELRGRLRLGVIPTALPAVGRIVQPLLERHPGVDLEVSAMSSRDIGLQMGAHGIDAGVTYLDNEPLGDVVTEPIYEERYVFVTPDSRKRGAIEWADLDGVEICLLSGEMQNRRILDGLLREARAAPKVRLETNSISALFSFLRSGWPCVVSQAWLDLYGVPEGMSARRIEGPEASHEIGLVVPQTGLMPPTVRALLETVGEGRR
ncbi:MAG: LysR family transcriptional regulator [Solirubrobacterales bacterium]